jgi:hypothetical protein
MMWLWTPIAIRVFSAAVSSIGRMIRGTALFGASLALEELVHETLRLKLPALAGAVCGWSFAAD